MSAEKPVVDRETSPRVIANALRSWENEASPGSVLGGPLHEALDQHPDERKC